MSLVDSMKLPDATLRRGRGRPRKTAEERDDGNRRCELVAAAARLFRLQGFAATTTRDIAAATGMHAGSPFYHFENKQALLAAVMQEGMESGLARQRAALSKLSPESPADVQLQVLVRNHLDVLLGDRSDFVPVMLYEWRSLDADQVVGINALKDAYEAAWVPVLDALHLTGQLAAEPALARLMIFGALNWSVQWYQPPDPASDSERQGGQGHQRRVSLDELTHACVQLFLKRERAPS